MIKLPDKLKALMASSKQKQSWVWPLKFGALFGVFLILFLPVYQRYSVVSSNSHTMRQQIEDIKKMSVNLLTPKELMDTENHVKDFETRLIDSAQASKILDAISNEAEKNHLNVIQIFSDTPDVLRDQAGKEVDFKGKRLMLLPINFRVEADYKSLGNFMKSVMDNIQGNAALESLTLKKGSPESEKLECDITLSYVVL